MVKEQQEVAMGRMNDVEGGEQKGVAQRKP